MPKLLTHEQQGMILARLEYALRVSPDADWILTGIHHRVVSGCQTAAQAITLTLDSWDELAQECSICRDTHISDDRHPCE